MPFETLDIRTIFFATTCLALTNAIVTFFLWRSYPAERALPVWAAGAVVVAAGYLGVALRDWIPPFISIALANACISMGHALLLRGVQHLTDSKPLPLALIAVIGVGIVASFSFFTFVHANTAIRMAIQFAVLGVLAIATARHLWTNVGSANPLPSRVVAGILTVFGSSLLIRVALMSFDVPGQDLFASNMIHELVFMILMLFYAALMYCFPVLLFNKDINRRERAEEALHKLNLELEARVESRTGELLAAKNEAERANAAKSEFLSRMSHELRTPLNAILGFGQILNYDGKLNASQHDSVGEILKAGKHLLDQVNEVLDLSRIESGHIELQSEPVALGIIARECLAQLMPLATQRGIRVELNCAPDLAVMADQGRLRQVLLNLLSNAIKYNREGGLIRIDVDSLGERLRCKVEDTGRGIAPESKMLLFKPFERLESAYDPIEGTGIGLALVKMLVEVMGGQVGFDSEPGVGSTFWFDLPRAKLPPTTHAA